MKFEKISIIIRTKNEEKWITSCLKAVFSQEYPDFEVIVVDNMSTDKTVAKAKQFDVKIIRVKDFLPGHAINEGIRASRGDILVMLSGHCIPVNDKWLTHLVADLKNPKVAGVYGRQEPLPFSSDADKRDLTIVFGLDKKIQHKDPFFHNANSAIRREMWKKIPFDEKVTNIEDRVWGKAVVNQGYRLVYEPKASVYHYHGIHQEGNIERCRNVVRILESLEEDSHAHRRQAINLKELKVAAIIPVRGPLQYCASRPLLEYTIEQAKGSQLINEIIVAPDDAATAKIARQLGAKVPFLRPEELSRDYVGLNTVLQYILEKMESAKILPDIVVVLDISSPFRPKGFLDQLIRKLIEGGFDSVLPVKREQRMLWVKDDRGIKMLDQGFTPRQLKDSQVYVSLHGVGLCTYPSFIRDGRVLGDKVGVVEISDVYEQIEVKDSASIEFAQQIMPSWQKDQEGR
jgi:CMP-N-acetylneuraminic acid synthetase/GT2 family glycosyltransferase